MNRSAKHFILLLFSLIFFSCSNNHGISERVTVDTLKFTEKKLQDRVTLKRVFKNHTYDGVAFLTSARDGSGRIFVVSRYGIIYSFQGNVDAAPTVFLDISSQVSIEGTEGMLSLAFDPDFINNGYFYVHYSSTNPYRRAVISRFNLMLGNPAVADPSSELVIIEIPQPSTRHKGGMMAFGADNLLYSSIGDGGDDYIQAQDTSNMLGSIIRLDVSGATMGTPYVIPPTNPFVGQVGVAEEIWAYGFRNPWRFSFDRVTGKLWEGDVGEHEWEEINIIESGGNYGWSLFEGFDSFLNPSHIPFTSTVPPTYIYSHNETGGGAITAGYVYRGSDIDWLIGKFVYADYVIGTIWMFDENEPVATRNSKIGQGSRIISFGEDEDGEIYVIGVFGEIYKIVKNEASNTEAFPSKLSKTGFFKDLETMEPEDGIVEYDLNSPFWSDGLLKRRWIALPGKEQITFSDKNSWDFPVGTVVAKHFEWDLENDKTRKIETRFLVHHTDGWAGYTYEWNDAQTDATLIDEGKELHLTESGKTLSWPLPSRGQCLSCHNTSPGFLLGVKTAQLNKSFKYENAEENQLEALNYAKFFIKDIGKADQYEKFASVKDTTASLVKRARSYLDTNCSQCHQPGANIDLGMDLRFNTDLEDANILNVDAEQVTEGHTNTKRLMRGNKSRSEIYLRLTTTSGTHMPPFGSNKNDTDGANLIGQWINSLD